jgi:hypothetical protein
MSVIEARGSEEANSSAGRGDGLMLPMALGALLALAAATFVVVELAEPPIQPGFQGIALSNAGNSRGARTGLKLFRDHFDWLPYPASGLILSPDHYVYGLRIAVVAMALVQVLALGVILRRKATSLWPWLVGPALASIVLLAYPPVNTDVFSYASFGWVSNQGSNPYLVAPAKLAGDPFKRMNDWTHITTPYGPIWTGLSRLIVFLARDDPFAAAIGFKVVAGLSSIGLGILTYHIANQLTSKPSHAIGAMTLVIWSPILLAESAGTAHNDAPMMLLAMAGLLLVTSRQPGDVRMGLLAIMAAILIKPVALPLLALAALVRFTNSRDGLPAVLKQWALDLLALAAFAGLMFMPYWANGKLPSIVWDMQKHLYLDKALHVNPLWVWALPRAAGRFGADGLDRHASTLSRFVVALLIALAAGIVVRAVRRPRGPSSLPAEVGAWAAVTAALGLAPINAHAWYSIWALAPVALVWVVGARTSRSGWLVPYLAWLVVSFLVYHTWPVLGTKVY